jgi:hypothetical protein
VLLSGCLGGGGRTRQGGYQCTAPQNLYGCWTQLTLSHAHINPDGRADLLGDPVGITADIAVAPLSCNGACELSSGPTNPVGYIANYIELYQSSNGWGIRAGYETTTMGNYYYASYYLGAAATATVFWVPTNVDPGFTGSYYPYATFVIGPSDLKFCAPPGCDWVAGLWPPGVPIRDTTFDSTHVGVSPFHPDYILIGQVVYGTTGATAPFATFTNIYYTYANANGGGGGGPLTEAGVSPVEVVTVNHPTDANWYIHPSASDPGGGAFYTACC